MGEQEIIDKIEANGNVDWKKEKTEIDEMIMVNIDEAKRKNDVVLNTIATVRHELWKNKYLIKLEEVFEELGERIDEILEEQSSRIQK